MQANRIGPRLGAFSVHSAYKLLDLIDPGFDLPCPIGSSDPGSANGLQGTPGARRASELDVFLCIAAVALENERPFGYARFTSHRQNHVRQPV